MVPFRGIGNDYGSFLIALFYEGIRKTLHAMDLKEHFVAFYLFTHQDLLAMIERIVLRLDRVLTIPAM
ncbi:MAG: hypothetical protein ABL921_07525 [Pirellula sp.]